MSLFMMQPRHITTARNARILPCTLLACLLLAGCDSGTKVDWPKLPRPAPGTFLGQDADPKVAKELSKLRYPKGAPVNDDLDILAVQKGFNLVLTNRTPTAYKQMELWLNQQYVGRVPAVDVGAQTIVKLRDVINTHGEPYPVGGLLNPDKSFPILLAELYDPRLNRRYRLLVTKPNP